VSAEPETAVAEDEAPQRLSTAEVAERAGISYRQCDLWARSGYLHPEHEGGTGNGRDWTPQEAEIARRMGRLVAAGFLPAWSADFARTRWPSAEVAPGITVSVTG
jgi:hypothetical protein